MGDKQMPKGFPLIKNGMPHNLDGSSITMEQWLGDPPEFDHIDEVLKADVIVLGAGVTGTCAVRSAAEKGAKVMLFEKMNGPRGRSGDIAVIGSKLEKEWWGRDNTAYREEIINQFMRDLGWRPNYRTIKYWAYKNGEDFDWFMEGTPDIHVQKTTTEPVPADCRVWVQPERLPLPREDWKPSDEYIATYPVTLRLVPSLVPTMIGNYRLAEKTGNLHSFFNTPARKLLRGSDGSITGVIAENYKTGKVYQCDAKSVILATGDFAGNSEMLYYYIPWAIRDNRMFMRDPSNEWWINYGDGHKMGLWAGAVMEDGPLGMINHCMGGVMGCSSFLNLNVNGERFMNEEITGQEWENVISRQRKSMAYQIFDSNWQEHVIHMAPGHGSACGIAPDITYENPMQRYGAADSYANAKDVEASCQSGLGPFGPRSIKADTLEELIDKLDLDEAAKTQALGSIARYNDLVHAGKDVDFGKKANHMFPVEKGPFYASRVGTAGILNTVGGLDCDHNCRVFDSERIPIPGLYVTGNIQGGRFPVQYPMLLPGISHSMCITYGRLTGRNATEFAKA